LKIFGKTCFRTISPTQMAILTDRELIIIREEKRGSERDKYGGIWDYIPLKKIVSLSLIEKDNNLLMLHIQLPESNHLELLYQASAKDEIKRFMTI